MARLEDSEAGVIFRGTVDLEDDLAAAASIANSCASYRRDDEDEDPLDGAPSCFGCRYRRWLPAGFTCMKDALARST